jgi:transposase
LMINMETRKPIDVLDDRQAATLTDWLREHPGVQVVCRDRAGACSNPRELHQTGVFSLVA